MPRFKLVISMLLCSSLLTTLAGCSPASTTATVPPFDGNRAFDLLKKQVAIGPRYPGSRGHEAAADMIRAELKPYADGISTQEFTREFGGKVVKLQNIAAYFHPAAKKWVLLAAHWDTRPIADQEVTAEKKRMPIPGANDGASGVAVLLELARVFANSRPDVGVFMVFFDGEDYAVDGSSGVSTMFLGSNYFAENLSKSAVVDGKQLSFEYGILLDMVGDKDLRIYPEGASVRVAPAVVRKVWQTAKELGYQDVFDPADGQPIMDDHLPLIKAGVKCIDVIDFDYAPWHTLDDTVDKCSAKSLGTVGEVMAHVIYAEKAR